MKLDDFDNLWDKVFGWCMIAFFAICIASIFVIMICGVFIALGGR